MSTPPYYPVPPTGPPARNTLGVVSLATGIALLAWNFAFVVLQSWTISSENMAQLGILGLLNGFVVVALAITAIGCGIAGLLARDRPRIAAGIGTGIGAAGLAGLMSGLLYSVLIPVFGG